MTTRPSSALRRSRTTRCSATRPAKSATILALGLACALLAACDDEEPDAYGSFEARDVVVSAEIGGRLLRFDPAEGDRLSAGQVVGRVDTTGLVLQRRELLAQRQASRTRTAEAAARVDVLLAQLEAAREEYGRTLRLYRDEAATAQQLTRTERDVRVLEEQIEAARAQAAASVEDVGGTEARVEQIEEQIERSRITNPVAGTVLATYAEPGEFAQPGAPLYRIASLDTLILRAYVSGAQLENLRLGEQVEVRVDAAEDELRTMAGRLTSIASEAEFTPTPIQTREERTDQVYAVRIRVPNPDGAIKIGMPGEVVLERPESPGS